MAWLKLSPHLLQLGGDSGRGTWQKDGEAWVLTGGGGPRDSLGRRPQLRCHRDHRE